MNACRLPSDFIPPTAIDKFRTKLSVGEFVVWVDEKWDVIRKDWPNTLWCWHRVDRAANVLFEESIPLRLMLEHEKGISRGAIVVIRCDGGADDARLLACQPDGTDQSIQITFNWGKGEAQTNKCLIASGHAYAWRAMMDDNFTAEKVIELIRRKESKAYSARPTTVQFSI